MTHSDDTDELAAIHRGDRGRLAHWEAFAQGTLDVEAATRAARGAGESEEAIERAKLLFAPLDPAAFEARFDDDAARASSRNDGRPNSGPSLVVVAEREPAKAEVAPVLPIRKWWFLPSVAAAAGVLVSAGLWWSQRQAPGGATGGAPTMVEHELAIVGVAEVRGDRPAVASVPAGGKVRFVLRPATRHEVAPMIWACAVRDGEARRLSVDIGAGEVGGAVQGTASIPAAFEEGEWRLVTFVASEPTTLEGDDACATKPSASVKLAEAPIVVR